MAHLESYCVCIRQTLQPPVCPCLGNFQNHRGLGFVVGPLRGLRHHLRYRPIKIKHYRDQKLNANDQMSLDNSLH